MNRTWIKIISTVATAIGAGATLVLNWYADKDADLKIEEKVIEALANQKK